MGWSETVHATDCSCSNCQTMRKMPVLGLNKLRDKALQIAEDHGFKDASIPEDFALMHSEISEALEDYRDGHTSVQIWYEKKVEGCAIACDKYQDEDGTINKPRGIPSEMADLIIRVLHFCGKHKVNIEQAVQEKMLYNETRPYKHGKIL